MIRKVAVLLLGLNSQNPLGRLLLLYLILTASLFLIISCGATDEQRAMAQKAIVKLNACKSEGSKFYIPKGRCLVWDLEANDLHPAHDLLEESLKYKGGNSNGQVSIFLVTAKQSEKVGTYSISKQPAYREWVNIYVVESPDFKPVGAYEVGSLTPRQSRPVSRFAEYGDVAPPIAEWIRSLFR